MTALFKQKSAKTSVFALMKKMTSLTLALILAVSGTGVFAEDSYQASDWALDEISKAKQMELIPESLLSEDLTKSITRKEFAAVSVKLYEKLSATKVEEVTENPFADTDDSYVLKAYKLGITSGTDENEFSPDSLLDREQAAVMLARTYKKVFQAEAAESEKTEKFADDELISDWAKESVYFISSMGVINGVGDNKFAPKNTTEEEIQSGYANASREQAIIIATRMVEVSMNITAKTADPYEDSRDTPDKQVAKDDNKYTVAFIGGSLTEGGSWLKSTTNMLQEKMPDKELVTINAGKGGTRSNYGTARFMEDVGKYAPDMVVIEFAVNDCGQDYELFKAYTEGMVRQCLALPKLPVVIFIYAPHPVEKDSEKYEKCVKTIESKEQIAQHYGIKSINIYDYMQRDYEKVKEEKGYSTFTDYLANYYQKSGDGFDTHGGYEKFAEAIIEEFEKDFEGCMTKPKNAKLYCTAKSAEATSAYTYLYVNGSRLHFSGPWKKYTQDSQLSTNDSAAKIGVKQYKYPFFPTGVMQVRNEQAAFGFMSKAEAFALNYITSTSGNTVKVYADNKEIGSISTDAADQSINNMSKWIPLPNDGKEHKIVLIIDKPTTDKYIFTFGAVIERKPK